jgi:RecB family exonuclease
VIRGRIDCLVWRPDGGLTVVEFKTGRARAEHEVQAQIYVSALRAIEPDRTIDLQIVYP